MKSKSFNKSFTWLLILSSSLLLFAISLYYLLFNNAQFYLNIIDDYASLENSLRLFIQISLIVKYFHFLFFIQDNKRDVNDYEKSTNKLIPFKLLIFIIIFLAITNVSFIIVNKIKYQLYSRLHDDLEFYYQLCKVILFI